MTDFRMANIPKQEAYDLLRDWIKLVARHTNPDQEISELLGWLWKLKPANPDPITGLMPCGCGGQAFEAGQPDASDFVFECFVCGIRTKSSPNRAWAEQDWNEAMGKSK